LTGGVCLDDILGSDVWLRVIPFNWLLPAYSTQVDVGESLKINKNKFLFSILIVFLLLIIFLHEWSSRLKNCFMIFPRLRAVKNSQLAFKF